MSPQPSHLLARIPLFCAINPLKRPRANYFSGAVRQPLENQRELLDLIKVLEPLGIDEPCHVQVTIVFETPELKRKSSRIAHPTKHYHGDIDNLSKAINDALVKAKVLVDDRLIVSHSISKAYGNEPVCYVAVWAVSPNPIEINPWALSCVPISVSPSTPPSSTSTQG